MSPILYYRGSSVHWFYYSPERPEVKALFDCLPTLSELYPWRDPAGTASLCADWPFPDNDELAWQFSVLFEGQGEMPVPPWGSVWLERDNLLMGNTTAEYRAFLQSQGMTFNRVKMSRKISLG